MQRKSQRAWVAMSAGVILLTGLVTVGAIGLTQVDRRQSVVERRAQQIQERQQRQELAQDRALALRHRVELLLVQFATEGEGSDRLRPFRAFAKGGEVQISPESFDRLRLAAAGLEGDAVFVRTLSSVLGEGHEMQAEGASEDGRVSLEIGLDRVSEDGAAMLTVQFGTGQLQEVNGVFEESGTQVLIQTSVKGAMVVYADETVAGERAVGMVIIARVSPAG